VILTDFTDKDRPTEHWLLREFADRSLSVFLGSKFDNSGKKYFIKEKEKKKGDEAHPQPLETPVGVTSTSAKRTSPAANQKLPINILLDNSAIPSNKKGQKKRSFRSNTHPPQSLTLQFIGEAC
jgi:hypothetical protein